MFRFEALTGFRCLAACMVFVYHNRKYWRDALHPEFLRWINEFHIGVSLFFVLSGFLIAYTYADQPLKSGKEYLKYISVRMLRILPLYWLILTFYYLDPSYGKMNFTPLTYSLFHGFSQRYNLYAIAQAWSLNVEMTFYFFAPLLCFLQRRHLLYLLGFMVLLLMAFLATGEIWYGLNHNPGQWLYPAKFVIGASFPGRCAEFLAGMLLAAALRNKRTEWIQKIPFKTWLGFLGIFITAYVIGQFQPDKFHHGADNILGRLIQNFVLPGFTVLALAGLIFERTLLQRFFSSRWMVLLGNASFAFYLVHISYVNLKIKSWFLLPDRNFVVLWIVSVLLYFLFEKPIYERGKKWIKKSGWVKP